MPNITRIVGMHNHTPEANRDAVWAGLVLRHDNGTYQFMALNGRRLGALRESAQPVTTSVRANEKFEQMYREKLAHGYTVIDWTAYRYGLQGAIRNMGDYNQAESIMPAAPGQGDAPHPQVVPVDRPGTPRIPRTRATQPAAAPGPALPPEPSVDALLQYIASSTNSEVVAPEPEKPTPAVQPPIRKARRLDF